MTRSSHDVAALTRQAMAALREGRPERAREIFSRAAALPEASAPVWLGLAFANARLGEDEATLAAVDKALELEPRNLRALIFKGDHHTEFKRSRKALGFYQAALKVAGDTAEVPKDVREGLARAQANCRRFAGEYEDYLLAALEEKGYRRGSAPSRFEQALDIAFGKKEIYYQRPTRFYYPELPQIQFYERGDFPWLEQLEGATGAIRRELLAVLRGDEDFQPYLQSDPDAVNFNDTANLDSRDWGAFYFYLEGELVEENAGRCPATMAALNAAPLPRVEGSTPHALYSRLAGGARIPPHHGLINTRLICHLPLLVPESRGGLRVGNRIQHWREGEAYVFDDTMEHEAWNDGDSDRVVLLFDIWRPELSEEERRLVGILLQSVRGYGGE